VEVDSALRASVLRLARSSPRTSLRATDADAVGSSRKNRFRSLMTNAGLLTMQARYILMTDVGLLTMQARYIRVSWYDPFSLE
jgi:hypothetical protein